MSGACDEGLSVEWFYARKCIGGLDLVINLWDLRVLVVALE